MDTSENELARCIFCKQVKTTKIMEPYKGKQWICSDERSMHEAFRSYESKWELELAMFFKKYEFEANGYIVARRKLITGAV